MSEKRCYTVKELQAMLDVSRPSVYELLKKNGLNHKSCGIYNFAHTPDVKYQTLSGKNNRHRDTHNPSFGLF